MQKFIFLVACLGSFQLNAQSYYPGGLGKSKLLLWLNAKNTPSITQNGSNQVSQWADLSSNGYNFLQGTPSNAPVYGATASPAGKPALTFTSTNSQYLSLASLPATISFTGGISAFSVASYNAPQTAQGWQRIFDFGNGQGSDNFMMGRYGSTANTYYEGWKGGGGDQTYTTSTPITNGAENLYEVVQQPGTAGNLTAVAHYLAGAAQTASGQAAGISQTYIPAAKARNSNFIGRSNWSVDNYFSGTMSEILIYDTALNTTQRVILENYAAAEWNQAVSVSKYTPPTATTYTTNLVGIGYTNAVDTFLTDVAGSTDGLGFSSGTTALDFLQNAGYVMAAHNAQNNTVISNTTIPGIFSSAPLNRWNRSWNVQKTGGTIAGAVTLNFNFSDYNGSTPGANTYALLYNATDGSFSSGTNQLATTSSTIVSASMVSFKMTASKLAAGYYTIIYSTSPIVLPVVLNAFTITKQNSNSLLDWNVSSLTDLSRFDIQRADDGIHFSTIATVAAFDNTAATGAGANSTTAGVYAFTDSKPLPGKNYYRLAMVNQDGTVAYSAIHTISFDAGSSADLSIHVYPNPATDRLHLAFTSVPGRVNIRLIDTRGQVLRTVTAASASVDIPVNDLTKGIYIVEVSGTNIQYAREFMKN